MARRRWPRTQLINRALLLTFTLKYCANHGKMPPEIFIDLATTRQTWV
jgi:hypothetical protein